MPIRIHCPNGCLLRMPTDRAGKKVRCPGCKAIIALPPISGSELRSGKPIPLQAILVDSPTSSEQTADRKPDPIHSPTTGTHSVMRDLDSSANSESAGVSSGSEIENGAGILSSIQAEKVLSNADNSFEAVPLVEIDSKGLPPDHADYQFEKLEPALPQILSPYQLRQLADATKEQRQKLIDSFEPISYKDQETMPATAVGVPLKCEPGYGVGTPAKIEAWRERLLETNSNRIALTKALAILVFVVGIINAGPAIFHWYQSWSSIASVAMPRWIYLLVFVAALHVVYAIFLYQVSDWSSLRAVSVAMLAFAFGFGIVSTALLIEGGHGVISGFFSLPHRMVNKATIWTASMLCLATLVAYISGKEASDWKRAEQLLVEILNKSA